VLPRQQLTCRLTWWPAEARSEPESTDTAPGVPADPEPEVQYGGGTLLDIPDNFHCGPILMAH